ncbi:hypothetical protein DA89_3307 [Vibrio paracholerae]|nr:hypothetical protein DA89_3307 [Vibrio paracholerae]
MPSARTRHVEYRSLVAAASHPATAPSASRPAASGQSLPPGARMPVPHPLGNTVSHHCAAVADVAARPATAVLASVTSHHRAYAPSTDAHRSADVHADNAPPPPPPANGRNHPATGANGQTPIRQLALVTYPKAKQLTFHRRKSTRRRAQSGCAGALLRILVPLLICRQ